MRKAAGQRQHKLPSGVIVTTFARPPQGLNILEASSEELQRYGLPSRPDPKAAPALFAKWHRTWGRQLTFVVPEFTETSKVRRQPFKKATINDESSQNWSGIVVSVQGGDLITGAVAGEWNVPSPADVDGGEDHCSIWVGIDGDPTTNPALANNLVQAGIECVVDGAGTQSYYPWWEWLPVSETPISNFPVVGPFDVSIWITSNTTANVYMINGNGQTTLFGITAPPTVSLIGGCAEWIVERPLVGGRYATLPNYGSVDFADATAWTASHNSVNAGSGTAITMVDEIGKPISKATILSPERLRCDYVG